MTPEWFVSLIGATLAPILYWSFRTLPRERWQILASIPMMRDEAGQWTGLNLTYYGALVATGATAGMTLFIILNASVGVDIPVTVLLCGLLALFGLPASSLIARVIEKKPYTFTVAGAVFSMLLLFPLLTAGAHEVLNDYGNWTLMPTLAAVSISHLFAEGIGRLACVSFGCCYGKPLSDVGPFMRRLCGARSFIFHGATKKIAYASGLEGVRVAPIQAITSCVCIMAGLAGLLLFLKGAFTFAFMLTGLTAHVWRLYSETLRADYRGEGRFSAYQIMSTLAAGYILMLCYMTPTDGNPSVSLMNGLYTLWNPSVILLLQGMWIVFFLYTGRSRVTGAIMSFHVHRDRV